MLQTNVNAQTTNETKVIETKKAVTPKKTVIKKEKKEVVKKETKEKSSLVKLNLSQFSDKLKNVEIKEKIKKDAKYIYPESFTTNDINESKGKKFRQSLRTKLERISNNIFFYTKTKEESKLIAEIKLFTSFYKENYLVNDYSLTSLSDSSNEAKKRDLTLLLDIAKVVNKIK